MEKIKGVVDLESSLKEPKPTLGVHINRVLASDLGLSVSQIANAIRPLIVEIMSPLGKTVMVKLMM